MIENLGGNPREQKIGVRLGGIIPAFFVLAAGIEHGHREKQQAANNWQRVEGTRQYVSARRAGRARREKA
jgi:hypothetical protein